MKWLIEFKNNVFCKSTKYKIVRETFWGAKSEIGESRFYIMKQKRFLIWTWWSYVIHKVHIENGIKFESIRFKTLRDADTYVHEVLKKNKPIDSVLRIELSIIE